MPRGSRGAGAGRWSGRALVIPDGCRRRRRRQEGGDRRGELAPHPWPVGGRDHGGDPSCETMRGVMGDVRLTGGERQARRYGVAVEPGEVIPRRLSDLGIRCYTSLGGKDFIACFIPTILYPGDEEYERYAARLPVIAVAAALPDGAPGRHRALRRRWWGRGERRSWRPDPAALR